MQQLIISVVIFMFSFSSLANEVLWRGDKNALAFCKLKKDSKCFVVVNEYSTDVSAIENKNIGKLGKTPKEQYNKVVTFPSKWQRTGSNGDLIIFTTQAWFKGQKYTVKGAVFVDSDGKFNHQ